MTLAVSIAPQVGMQNDKKTWVFGPDVTIDETGMAKTDSRNAWIGHLYSGPFIAAHNTSRIEQPLS